MTASQGSECGRRSVFRGVAHVFGKSPISAQMAKQTGVTGVTAPKPKFLMAIGANATREISVALYCSKPTRH